MTWSYFAPQASSKDTVRYLVGDTCCDDPLASDEEILWQLAQNADVYLAAAATAEAISHYFGRQASIRTPELSVDFAGRAKTYTVLAQQLRRQGAERVAIPYAGGISVSDKEVVASNADRVPPAFTVGLHRFPGGIPSEAVAP